MLYLFREDEDARKSERFGVESICFFDGVSCILKGLDVVLRARQVDEVGARAAELPPLIVVAGSNVERRSGMQGWFNGGRHGGSKIRRVARNHASHSSYIVDMP